MEKDESKIPHFHPTRVKPLLGGTACQSGVPMKETYDELYVTDVECACRTMNSIRIGPGGAVPPDPDDGRRYPPYFFGNCHSCGRSLWLMISREGTFDPEQIKDGSTRKAQCHCGLMNSLHNVYPQLDTRSDNPYWVSAYKNKCDDCGRILYYHIMESKGKKTKQVVGDY